MFPEIFSADGNHPGAGYTQLDGKVYRIMGTSSAGLAITPGTQYILDTGLKDASGETISINSPPIGDAGVVAYNTWIATWHKPDVPNTPYYVAPQASSAITPPPTTPTIVATPQAAVAVHAAVQQIASNTTDTRTHNWLWVILHALGLQ